MDHLLTKNLYDVSGRVALVTGGGSGMYVCSEQLASTSG
jgi:hypothetical protein